MIEVRIPTHKRPKLLHRALASLVNQRFQNWKGIVIDDSPEGEAKEVVEAIGDSRLIYQQNKSNLGLARNLSLSFSKMPFFSDSSFACVLEDDNYYRENFLENAIGYLENGNYKVFLGNAQIAQYFEDGRELLQERYTLSPIYGNKVREISYEERLKNVFSSTIVGNLCLVWSLHKDLNLEVKEEQYNAIVQEKMRGLAYKYPLIYDPAPNAIFTNFPDRKSSNKDNMKNRRIRRSQLALTRFWYKEANRVGINYQELHNKNEIKNKLLEALIINSDNFSLSIREIEILIRSLILYSIFPFQSQFKT
jgi:glycosyltransferase involved in cell wall biosynthesis